MTRNFQHRGSLNFQTPPPPIIHDLGQMMEAITKFYMELYGDNDNLAGGNSAEDTGKQIEWKEKTGEFPKIMRREVENAMEEAKNNKATVPDGIQNEILKVFKTELVPCLTRIFNEVVEKGWISEEWNVGEIIVLFKKGERDNIDSYRPMRVQKLETSTRLRNPRVFIFAYGFLCIYCPVHFEIFTVLPQNTTLISFFFQLQECVEKIVTSTRLRNQCVFKHILSMVT